MNLMRTCESVYRDQLTVFTRQSSLQDFEPMKNLRDLFEDKKNLT
jgi:hypothetical protein